MGATAWNDAEDEALEGLPWGAQVLYLRGLRRHMDFASGAVGERRRISWQMLGEVLYVEPHQGLTDAGGPHKSRVRRLVGALERAGLVQSVGGTEGKVLRFFLPLADRGYQASKKPDTNPTQTRHTQPDTLPDTDGGLSGKARTEKPDTQADTNPTHPPGRKPDTPLVSGIRKKNPPSGDSERGTTADAAEPTAGAKARGARLTLVDLPGDWGLWCAQERPDLDAARTWDSFRDYWIAQPGAKGVKADWLATWRNWVRRETAPTTGRGLVRMGKGQAVAESNRRAGEEFVCDAAIVVEGTVIEAEFRRVK